MTIFVGFLLVLGAGSVIVIVWMIADAVFSVTKLLHDDLMRIAMAQQNALNAIVDVVDHIDVFGHGGIGDREEQKKLSALVIEAKRRQAAVIDAAAGLPNPRD